MSKIREWVRSLSTLQIILSLTTMASLLIFLLLTIWCDCKLEGLDDQQAARRWSKEGGYAQVSAFLTEDAALDDFRIKNFENQLDTALTEAAVTSENENARLFIDAYSAQGSITVVSEQSTLEAEAIGIGGDFFFFHPLELAGGRYFSGEDLMKDFVLLDEEAAWQLFGSNDIEGMSVMIGGVPHYVAGVIRREKGRMAEYAGLKKSVIYVSYETLSEYGISEGISCYEVVAPNPVNNFVYHAVKEKMGLREDEMMVIENSSRYSIESMILAISDFGTRSMQNAAIHLPYWENIARGYEDIRAAVLLAQMILLLIPGVIIFVFLLIKWKHRKYKWKDIWIYFSDKKDSVFKRVGKRGNGGAYEKEN